MIIDELWTYLPLIFSVFIGSTIIALGIGAVSKLRRQNKMLRTDLVSVKRELNTVTRAAMGMGQRLVVLEQRFRHLENDVPVQEEPQMEEANSAISQALQMFDSGADVMTVATHCGLSRSEAELMALMRKNERRSGGRIEPTIA